MVLAQFIKEWNNGSDKLPVHTSGSTGNPKLLWVEKRRMEASARMTCDFLQLREGQTALLCLPVDYIAGKMMVVRAMVQKLQLISVEPDGHPLKAVEQYIDFAAMVPLQVYNSLQNPIERERLRRIRHLIIGGSAIDSALARQLKDFPNAVWNTYGMTETLSHIALRRLNGCHADDWYTPLSGVEISLHTNGCLIVTAPHLCSHPLVTNDLAEIKPKVLSTPTQAKFKNPSTGNLFRILGRQDNVIISGGVKIQIEEVENVLRPHLSVPYAIVRCKDDKFGEVIGLKFVATDLHNATPEIEELCAICRRYLPKYWQPKHYLPVEEIELTATGKVKR